MPDLYTSTSDPTINLTVFQSHVDPEPGGEPSVVLNVLFNPWGGLEPVLKGKDVDGWALLRVVYWTQHEAVAVFERLS